MCKELSLFFVLSVERSRGAHVDPGKAWVRYVLVPAPASAVSGQSRPVDNGVLETISNLEEWESLAWADVFALCCIRAVLLRIAAATIGFAVVVVTAFGRFFCGTEMVGTSRCVRSC